MLILTVYFVILAEISALIFLFEKDCSSPSMWQPGVGLANFVSGWYNVVQAL